MSVTRNVGDVEFTPAVGHPTLGCGDGVGEEPLGAASGWSLRPAGEG
jgi:hypothetical protein